MHLPSLRSQKNLKAPKKKICEESLSLSYFGTTTFLDFLLMINMQCFSRTSLEFLLTKLTDMIHIIAFRDGDLRQIKI